MSATDTPKAARPNRIRRFVLSLPGDLMADLTWRGIVGFLMLPLRAIGGAIVALFHGAT